MTLLEAIQRRHSVRRYTSRPLPEDVVDTLRAKIEEVNKKGNLHVQLVLQEPKAFRGVFAYGKFSGVANYLVMAGPKADDLDERVGYYGEQLVLLAQTLGLDSCWAGLSYSKISDTYTLEGNEKIACYIALGYGETQGTDHRRKTAEELSNVSERTPAWFRQGVEAARLAPTAVNQQKFYFEYIGKSGETGKPQVRAIRKFSLVGYTRMDLGIAKLHFEIGAGPAPFEWV